ncbi:MAG: insulinase family protein [Erysipelotrichaceae bacterium]|nr:insulinase family protein [Erysipelotrichaceae bacterium]
MEKKRKDGYVDGICLLKTAKYKTVELYIDYVLPYDLKTYLSLCLLDNYLGEYSKSYPDKQSMYRARDSLYGVYLSSETRANVNLIETGIHFSFVNPRFLKDIASEDMLEYFRECFYNVFFDPSLLDEFKRNYKDCIRRRLDRPDKAAFNRVVQILSKEEERIAIRDIDHIEEIDTITLEDIKKAYERLLSDFSADVTLIGDYDRETEDFARKLCGNRRYLLDNDPYVIRDLGEIVEEKDVSQSVLNIIYATPYSRRSPDFYAFTLGNVLLGGVATSLLFEEVREKRSLCYYINALDYKNEGLVRICTAINSDDKDEVVSETEKQIKRLVDKDYDTMKLELARKLLIDSLQSMIDDPSYCHDYLYGGLLNGIDISAEEYEQGLLSVTMDDISRVFHNYSHVLTYLLKGNKDEQDI